MSTGTRFLAAPSLVAALSLISAWLVVTRPPFAAALALAVSAVVVLALGYKAPAARVLVLSVLGISATVDLIRRVEVGSISAYAWVTGLVALSAVVLALVLPTASVPRAARRTLALMALFPVWALLSIALNLPTQPGVQNILVYVAIPSIAAVSAMATATGVVTFASLRRSLFWIFWIASVLYGASLLLDGVGGGSVVDARAYALFAAIGVAWTAALGRYGYRPELRLALVMLVLTFLSLSRTAFAVALFVFAIGLVGLNTPRKVGRTLAILGAITVLGVTAVVYTNPFSDRFSEPDVVALPGGVKLSVTGRRKLWSVTLRSALESPVVGQGAGSAEVAVSSVSNTAGHPHNDYLRVFHDFGLIGLLSLCIAIAAPIATAVRSLRAVPVADTAKRALHLAAVLAPLALALEMITDNSLVYGFVVGPTAVIIGASLGEAHRDARRVSVGAPQRRSP